MAQILLNNDDVVRILAGREMGVADVDGNKHTIRIATTQEFIAQYHRSAAKLTDAGAPPPTLSDAELYAHARRLTQTVDLNAVAGRSDMLGTS
jgi:hypothetical protein